MGLNEQKKIAIKEVLKRCILGKFQTYNPETAYMPFHYKLLGKDRMALFSFIQSLNTTFGTSIYEPVAVELAKDRFKVSKTQGNTNSKISSLAHQRIQSIVDGIATASREPNKIKELEEIREVCNIGKMDNVRLTKVDIWLEGFDNQLYFLDIKTVKPNIGEFKGFKRTLLEWAAAEMAKDKNININTYIAIPYNPYEPKPYDRWTMRGIFDLQNEILVAEEFWDFVGGQGAYVDLLDCFELAGIELRPEIDDYFKKFQKSK